jgi:hypothetical protein
MRGSTELDNWEYDNWLAENKRERELVARKLGRRAANKSDMSGWHFGIDARPIKTKNIQEFRKELEKRGLAIDGEYTGRSRDQR